MSKNPLQCLSEAGQTIWLDTLQRSLVTSGKLQRLIEEDALRGVTSNPKIFENAIDNSDDYDEDIRAMSEKGECVSRIYEKVVVRDIQMATDAFQPVYERLGGDDGYVSLEVDPHLAYDTEGTIEQARHLWCAVDHPNLLIKIPATREGLPAISQCLSEGINVNVTLIFGLPRYREVAKAYLNGLEKRLGQGDSVERVRSVASFFLSRIDVLVDPMLEDRMSGTGETAALARRLHGQVAIASARQAYQVYKEIFRSSRFANLQKRGVCPQRLLWASTSTKNPDYSDVKYVDALVGENTVNTVAMKTLDAYREHGDPKSRIESDLDLAQQVMDGLPRLDIDIDDVTQQLEDEGVLKFTEPFDQLMVSLHRKCITFRGQPD